MRDYSEPRQSYINSTGNHSRQYERHEPSSKRPPMAIILICAAAIFFVGFASGWYLSHQAAKKAYRAAMEQKSLENTPVEIKPPQQTAQPTQQTATGNNAPQGQAGAQDQAGQQTGATGAQPLTFYDNLPSGKKNPAVLGSGINEKPKPQAPKPASDPSKPAPSAATPQPKSAEGFLVQVASFSSKQDAEATKTKLTAKGYSATISEINLNDKGTWYRVRVGRHLDKEAATEIASKLGKGAIVQPDKE